MDTADTALPTSYWHATAPPPVPADPLPASADVVVVGGGLLGVWTAYWLARAGVPVVLLEQTAVSWGATGRNGGFVRAGTAAGYAGTAEVLGSAAALALWRLTEQGQAMVGDIVAEEEIACDYRTPGTLNLALSEASLTAMRASMALMNADGLSGEVLDRDATQALIDTPLAGDIAGALWYADGNLLHSGRYLAGVAAAARRHGARFCRARVTALAPVATDWRLESSAGPVTASRVVIAVNAWTDTLVPALAGKIVPVRGQILAYAPGPAVFQPGIGTEVSPTGEYWQQTPDGSIIIGGCRAMAPGGDLGVRDLTPTPDVIASLTGVLPRLFPALTNLQVAQTWAGPMAFTADYLPVADAAPDMPGVWVTGGYCGHGMPFGPRVGQLLAAAATSGATPAALAPLRHDRPSLRSLAMPAAAD